MLTCECAVHSVTFEETDLGRRREAIAEASGWYTGNPSFGRVSFLLLCF